MDKKTRVLIVDDHSIVRKGLRTFLEIDEFYEVVGEASSGEESVVMAGELLPDLILMDVRMPGVNGIEACRMIMEVYPQIKIVMLTSYSDEESVMASIIAGARGYILKTIDTDMLLRDLERVSRGESLLDPAVTQSIFDKIKNLNTMLPVETRVEDTTDKLLHLTNQEKKILLLVAEGKTNKEIAAELFISSKTVRNYVTNILTKLNLSNRTQAAAFAVNMGLIKEK